MSKSTLPLICKEGGKGDRTTEYHHIGFQVTIYVLASFRYPHKMKLVIPVCVA
jgi:hypothetical protein